MVSIRKSERLRKSSLELQSHLSTKNKQSSTPMVKHISAKRVRKSPCGENSVESIDCLLNTTSNNGKKSFITPQKHVKRARRSAPAVIKQKPVTFSPRRTRSSQKISVQNGLDNTCSQKQVLDSPISLDALLNTPFPMKQISDKTSMHCSSFLPIVLMQDVLNKNETIKFSPRRTRSSQKILKTSNGDTRISTKQTSDSSPICTRSSLKIFQQQTSNEKSFASSTNHMSGKSLTWPKKWVPAKRIRKRSEIPEKQKSSKKSRKFSITPIRPAKKKQKSSTILPEETPVIGNTRHQKKSLVRFQKQATKAKKSSSNKQIVNGYIKDLESIPFDNLALQNSRLEGKAGFKRSMKHVTLKERRNAINAIRKADEGYEDDIYESKTFEKFNELFITDTPGSVFSVSMQTPVLGFPVTPVVRKKTPKFKDCFIPRDLSLQRKAAEEFIHRIKNRKRALNTKTPVVPEKKKLEFDEAISEGLKIQEADATLALDDSEEENEDNYFSD